MPALLLEETPFSCERIFQLSFGKSGWQKTVLFIDFVLRFCLTFLFFFLLAVAERTFKQRWVPPPPIQSVQTPKIIFFFFLKIFVRKTFLASDIVEEGSKIGIATFSFEQSAQHQNVAQCSILSQGKLLTKMHFVECTRSSFSFCIRRDVDLSGQWMSLYPQHLY